MKCNCKYCFLFFKNEKPARNKKKKKKQSNEFLRKEISEFVQRLKAKEKSSVRPGALF